MNIIELERWKPSEGNPRVSEYVGQRTAIEVFEELKARLDGMGYLPDEYFLLDSRWEDGRDIPKDADIFCATDYGESEGIYLDVYLWCGCLSPIYGRSAMTTFERIYIADEETHKESKIPTTPTSRTQTRCRRFSRSLA